MIFSYREVNHNIYLLHEHVAYIFKQMFYYDLPEYDENLLVHPDFLPIINAAKVPIRNPIREIVPIYHQLPYGAKLQLQIALSYNNDVISLSNKDITLIKYDDIHESIRERLKTFFVNLWDAYPQVVQMITDFGTVKSHYDQLVDETNCDGIICPFCGIDPFEPTGGKYREAYDHLLAKATYPFVSVNFDLLFPACHKCNSNEKRDTDTVMNTDGTRRAVYYPYDEDIRLDNLNISIVLQEAYNAQSLRTLLRAISWEFAFHRNGVGDERLESWDSIYGIKRRYREWLTRLEKVWFDELQSVYRREKSLGVSYADFKVDFMKKAKYQVLIASMGIIKYFYFSFLFSIHDFEVRLDNTLR